MTEVALAQLLTGREAGRWELDTAASRVEFTHKTMWGLMTVKGRFANVTGEGEISAEGALSGALHIGVASLDTHHAKRDKHLKSADFFAADTFPTMDYAIVSAAVEGSLVQVQGSLTVKGVSEPLQLTALIAEADASSVVLTAQTSIDRAQFGMSWNQLGMIRGSASVSVKAVFHRAAH